MATGWNGRFFNAEVGEGAPIKQVWDAQGLDYEYFVQVKGGPNDANGNALKALAMMTNTEMLAGSAKYIAYAPWRKSSIAVMEKGEPWYKDGKTNMVPQMPTAPQNTKNYFLVDPLYWADGSFLFLGPTGVGKTELCKALAEFLFDTQDAMVRIDMSEFMEKHSVSRLIGAPPGYVGYDEGGYLTEAVRRRPYSVILMDEVEKAHPDVFNVLLQVLDDGRLTDGQGRTVDFRNTVIVMTSNLGSDLIQTMSSDGQYDEMKEAVMGVVGQHFRPEFINRIDETVVFHPLGREQIRSITEIQMQYLHKRLAERDLSLDISAAALDLLGEAGFDPVYGARPLKRAIQHQIENPMAQSILGGDYHPGDVIKIDVTDGELSFAR